MSIFNKKFAYAWCAVFATIILTALAVTLSNTNKEEDEYSFHIQRDNIELIYEGARADLVERIDSTIRIYAPNTCMNALEILRQCEKYDVDIFFVLAQAHIESHFGTKGMAAKTNSVFNVFAFDGRGYESINENGKYKHPDLSIEPYLKLLTHRYLVGGKTEMDLMLNYVDMDGHRYASSEEYENNLTNMYQRYVTDEDLIYCFQQYNKYKILSGR